MSWIVVIFGTIAYLFSLYATLRNEYWDILYLNSTVLAILFMVFLTQTTHQIKSYFLSFTFLFLGTYYHISVGTGGAALAFLLAHPIFSALMLSRRFAIYSLILFTASLILLSALLGFEASFRGIESINLNDWFFYAPSALLTAVLLTIPISYTLYAFDNKIKQTNQLQSYLQRSRAEIQEKYKAEKEIREQMDVKNKKLDRSLKDFDTLIYSVTHDLRSPIHSLTNLMRLAQIEKDPNEVNHYLGLAEKTLLRADSFILDIIEYAKTKDSEVRPEAIDINEMIDGVSDDLKGAMDTDHILFSKEVEEKSPLITDALRLRMIVRNILSNAFKFYDPRKERRYVKVEAEVSKENLYMVISDNGIGVPKEQLERIFDLFSRGSASYKSTGIGLFLVKESVEKLHGSIQVESGYREGTSFTLRIPNSIVG